MSLEELKKAREVIDTEHLKIAEAKKRISKSEAILGKEKERDVWSHRIEQPSIFKLLIAIILLLIGLSSMIATFYYVFPNREYVPIPVIIKEQPIYITEEFVKIVKHIVEINATHVMTCLGEPNATELKCYRKIIK